jgi:phosphoglycolate phosphatase-like HAD superfamily hydrolase
MSDKSDEDLIGILCHSEDWQSEAVNEARQTLNSRNVSDQEIEKKVGEYKKWLSEELKTRASVEYSFAQKAYLLLLRPILFFVPAPTPSLNPLDPSYSKLNKQRKLLVGIGICFYVISLICLIKFL